MDFIEIVKQNKRNIKNIIRKYTKADNEDLEQEVYLKVLTAKKYEEKGNFKSWISTIAKNVSKDYLKSAKMKYEAPPDDEVVFYNVKDKKPNPELKLIESERQKTIIKAIEELKPKFREVIIFVEVYGLSYEECAKKLNCPEGTVKSRLYNAKKELAIKLQDLL